MHLNSLIKYKSDVVSFFKASIRQAAWTNFFEVGLMAYICGIAIFLSAFLLFQIQPLIARLFLPWFGGIPSVWTTCMLFFECVLLAGYGYSHWMAHKIGPRRQVQIHCALLGVVVLILAAQWFIWGAPLLPQKNLAPSGEDIPLLSLLGLLFISVGIPYLLVSTTSPLLQSWFAKLFPERSVYRLYALSNAGSLLALISYPFVIEPHFRLRTQAMMWGAFFLVFVILCACFGISAARKAELFSLKPQPTSEDNSSHNHSDESVASDEDDSRPIVKDWIGWILLAAIPSAALLSVTSQITMEIAPIPLLWIVPMVIYLGSFILTFDNPRFYIRPVWAALLVISSLSCVYILYVGNAVPIDLQMTAFLVFLGAACMLCHGEMAKRKPAPKYLTGFYLAMSIGGALGGIFVGVFAPLAFKGFWEVNFSIMAALWAILFTMDSRGRKLQRTLATVGVSVISLVILVELLPKQNTLENFRDFYGKYSIQKSKANNAKDSNTIVSLFSGRIAHGIQYEGEKNMEPLSYYHRNSGIGLLLGRDRDTLKKNDLRVGAVGLGIGTIAAYAREGDTFDFYELNPAVIDIARGKNGYFSYLSNAKGVINTIPGDGRLSLERRGASKDSLPYDIIVLDAFSSDSIPAHLLTAEAFQVYLQQLAPDGIIAVHISNRFVRLLPVLQANAHRLSLLVFGRDDEDWVKHNGGNGLAPSEWALLFRKAPEKVPEGFISVEDNEGFLWMDDYSPILPLIEWRN